MKKNKLSILTNGIIKENPVLVLVLGTCPTLATTTSAINGLGMGVAATAVLVFSNLLISLLKSVIPDKVRIPCYIVVIAGLVTVVQMLVQAYAIDLYNALGVFLPLIVVNCIILGRAEMFASKNSPLDSALDGLGMGMGFTLTLFMMGSIRELLGSGSIFGVSVLSTPIAIFGVAPGGFIVFGCLVALVNKITEGKAIKKNEFSCADCPVASVCGQSKLACEKGEC